MVFKCAFAVAALALLSGTSEAQPSSGQTPENARRFLAQALPGTSARSVYISHANAVSIGDNIPVKDLEAADCQIDFNAIKTYGENTKVNGVHGFFFSSMLEAKQDKTRVIITSKVVTETIELRSEALAARVAYAMEFLRQDCDKLSQTGF